MVPGFIYVSGTLTEKISMFPSVSKIRQNVFWLYKIVENFLYVSGNFAICNTPFFLIIFQTNFRHYPIPTSNSSLFYISGRESTSSTPPWEDYSRYCDDIDNEDSLGASEDTALLRSAAACTEIIVTPMSPAISTNDLSQLDTQEDEMSSAIIIPSSKMDLLKPDILVAEDVWKGEKNAGL